MRKFYLENEIGSRVGLNNEDGIFFYQPENLGLEFEHEYATTGSGFFSMTKFATTQLQPSGTLIFIPNDSKGAYDRYRELIDWIYSGEELFLVYAPTEKEEFYRKVTIQSLAKGELDTHAVLWCEVIFSVLTPWYLPIPLHVSFGEEGDDAMSYPFYYTDDLVYAVGSKDYSAEVSPSGHMPAAVKITFKGLIINPVFSVMGLASRKVLGECAIEGEFGANDTLILSTAEQDSYIICKDSEGNETDLLDSIDITKNPFFRLPLNEPCEVSISGDSILGTAEMQVYAYYRGV